jgi:hypothetical protein
MLTVKALLERESFFDAAIIRHGFTDYMRDYEIIVVGRAGPPAADIHRYLFVGCAEAVYQTAISPKYFGPSLPDDFVFSGPDYPEKKDPQGFIWGVRYANAYPGLSYRLGGERSAYWTAHLRRKMHEVFIETEAYSLLLVFADLRYAYLGTNPDRGVMRPKDYPIPPAVSDATSDGGVS